MLLRQSELLTDAANSKSAGARPWSNSSLTATLRLCEDKKIINGATYMFFWCCWPFSFAKAMVWVTPLFTMMTSILMMAKRRMIMEKEVTCEADAPISIAGRAISIFELDNLEDAQNWKILNISLMIWSIHNFHILKHFSCLEDPWIYTYFESWFLF